jgi:hypothetical protein
VGHVALDRRVLECQRHELGVVAVRVHGLTPAGDGLEGGGEVDLLEGARAEYLRVDLARQR